jgi:hypothetical protein
MDARRVDRQNPAMDDAAAKPPSALQGDEILLVEQLTAELATCGSATAPLTIAAIRQQRASLELFAELLLRYPSPQQEQVLDGRRRGLDTLVEAMVQCDQASFPFRAPTQALVGRAMNMAQINFLRLCWHAAGGLPEGPRATALRETAARLLRASVHTRLVEEALVDIVTDGVVRKELRGQAVRNLAQLWGDRLTWRAHAFFPILAATWEARQRVRVVGGTLLGNSELMQLLVAGGEPEFVELLLDQDYGEVEVQAFREFLFGTSSEELDRLAARMAKEGLSSIEIDSRIGEQRLDAGSLLFEFFRHRLVQCGARRLMGLPGPRHTAEGYVMLAWLEAQCEKPPEA